GNGRRCSEREAQVAFRENSEVMAVIVRRRHLQRDTELVETPGNLVWQERMEDALHVELRDSQAAHHPRKRGWPGAPHASDDLRAARQYRTGIMLDVLARHAGSHAGSHDRSDRRPGDGHGPDAKLVEGFDDMDMGKAARAAAAEGDGEGRVAASFRCRAGFHPLLPSVGPTVRIAGSAVSSFFATALTWSSVTASMSSARLSM